MDLVQIINSEGKAVPVKIVNAAAIGGIGGVDVETGLDVTGVSYELDDDKYHLHTIQFSKRAKQRK